MDLRTWGPTTFVLVALTVIAAVAGAVVVITDHDYASQNYLNAMVGFAVALGLLGIGRGVRLRDHPIAERTKGRRKTSRGEAGFTLYGVLLALLVVVIVVALVPVTHSAL